MNLLKTFIRSHLTSDSESGLWTAGSSHWINGTFRANIVFKKKFLRLVQAQPYKNFSLENFPQAGRPTDIDDC